MIFGKINPAAQIVKQTAPFEQQTIIAEWITAIARPYILGSTSVSFQVNYGNLITDPQGDVTGFNSLFNDSAVLTSAVISNWGTDDAFILNAIAEQKGTTVTETINANINQMM